MFILHSSNKTENLVAHLIAVIESSPPASPFEKEVFLIQSQGMERWLSQRLASHFNVWGNYEFLFPARFFSSLAQKIGLSAEDGAFERSQLLWRFEAVLRRCLDGAEFLPLTQYLTAENIALKRYQLAQQLAQIFDQYQIMRPDMLAEWQSGRVLSDTETEHWQQALWRLVTAQIGSKHRGAVWLDVIAALNLAEEGSFNLQLPERVFIFGLNTMPPLFLSCLQALAKHCQVHLFLLNPARTFWADLETRRQQARAENFSGHPLLSTLGQQGREFQEMLLELAQFDFEPESFETTEAGNNLHHLQNDILNNRPAGRTLCKDNSISIHACHSRMREVEVLKNLLLQSLENDPDLELRDMVVMAPDIQVYEPFIAAIFNDIQHAIADRSLHLNNSALDALIRFLNLSQSRFGWQSVLDLLEQPAVYSGFGLSEADLELIRHWVRDTHVRWGKSAIHKQELGLPGFNENTWQAMLDRLLMGYAVGSDEDFVDAVLPYRDIEGSSALALGGLHDFLQLVFKAGMELKQAKTLKAWSGQLYYYADQLLADADPGDRRQINELLAVLSDELAVVHNDEVELQVIVSWLQGAVEEHKSSLGFLRGQLTFCSMLPMRSIPFKVIALLGMNDGEFPNATTNPTFDLLAKNFRQGDRSRRADDRYQFLEILLSARQQLIMTYIGQSNATNAVIPPSVVISELLEVLQDGYQLADLITRHPLQPFSPRYFNGNSDLFSFSEADCETARALSAPKPQTAMWWQGALNTASEEIIDLNELFSFFRHPQRYFMRRRMELRFNGIEADAEEREPFNIDRLDSYSIGQEWVRESLSGRALSIKKLQAQGRWLPSILGELEFEGHQKALNEFVGIIKAKDMGEPLPDLPVDLDMDDCRLVGKLGNRYKNGSFFYRYADLKGKDFICAVLHHMIINRLQEQSTFLLSIDKDLILLPKHCQLTPLIEFIKIYRLGQQQPDAFFVEPALAYVKQAYKLKSGSRATVSALDAAREYLAKALERPYELELRRLYHDVTDMGLVLGESFEQHCESLLLPIWETTHEQH
ncbi:RecBCD enzyme subunit RecC [Candidatus Methylobacter favarea]|uniref:RecBCD enzyme subunit RecC n=1 Tax=Candidatus Methylobacter favarea TaxID=2707345 RepID=A0A8S0WD43_9GAMM|nr:exodeoxyribonuclease V subunit gamma [Candidatus Methylobacter favarea]CAA9892965.1 RecBCD enzyme subunit RecC [Candidatus Methylobacter favarea]